MRLFCLVLFYIYNLLVISIVQAGEWNQFQCCRDLEMRVDALEKSVAEKKLKGQKKVSIEIDGELTTFVLFHDTNFSSITNNIVSSTKFGLIGKARILPSLEAGYRIQLGVASPDTIYLRRNQVYLSSKVLGKLTIGMGSTASNGIAELDYSGTFAAGSDDYDLMKFAHLDGDSRQERIRYDTPTIMGFVASASWQDDSDYDLALTYKFKQGKKQKFFIKAGIAYLNKVKSADRTILSGSTSIYHKPSGVNFTYVAGNLVRFGSKWAEYENYKIGYRNKFFTVGETVFALDYQKDNVASGLIREKYRLQFLQKLDALNMDLAISAWTAESNQDQFENGVLLGSKIVF